MSTPKPITAPELAGLLQQGLNVTFGCDIADEPRGAKFEFTAPATGQRFSVVVAEVSGWSKQMDDELAEIAAKGAQ